MSQRTLPEQLFRTEGIPVMPRGVEEFVQLCRSEEATLDELVARVEGEPDLSRSVVALANSHLFGFGDEAQSTERAVQVLGVKSLGVLTHALALVSELPRAGATGIDHERFWQRALVRGVCSRLLAGVVRSFTEDEAFVAGLVSEVGQLVLAASMPVEYEAILRASGTGWPSHENEQRILGFDSLDVGEALLEAWSFPPTVHGALRLAFDPHGAREGADDESTRTVARVLAAAHTIADVVAGASSPKALETLAATHDELDAATIDRLVRASDAAVVEAAEAFGVDAPRVAPSDALADAHARLATSGLPPEREVAELPATGPRALLERLREDAEFVDPITGAPGRSAFDAFLSDLVSARIEGRSRTPIGMLAVRVDQCTDGVDNAKVAFVASVLMGLTRASELVSYNGDAVFHVLLDDGSPFALRALSDRLRRGVAESLYEENERPVFVSVSIGGTCLDGVTDASHKEILVEAAHRYLTKATEHGASNCLIHGGMLRPI